MSRRLTAAALVWLGAAGLASAAPPAPSVRMTFRQAIARAMQQNPSVQQAAQVILQAQALLRQATSVILPSVDGSVTNATLNTGVTFNGEVAQPQNQTTLSVSVTQLLYAPVQWAERTQAADNERVARLGEVNVKREVAVATAEAYLAIIASRRVYQADVTARDTAKAHYDLAHEQLVAGAGSRLDELRARQALSSDEVLVADAAMNVYRAQEALGVLLAVDHPVDTDGEPTLDLPTSLQTAESDMAGARADLRLAAAQEQAATRVYDDSWKDRLPSVSSVFTPQDITPVSFFQKSKSWRLTLEAAIPIFDSGLRSAEKAQRLAALDQTKIARNADLRQARSDVRTAEAAVASAGQALTAARAAAEQAREVVRITDISFKAGASTDIEVIDAQQASLDADTAAAQAEDQLRQAKLALLVALGQFP
ncbi:MAG TPA: TolC family protein [Vicinamibacterales bacterium]|nr:TolC family protein [Vicinamibacterales bacterium]